MWSQTGTEKNMRRHIFVYSGYARALKSTINMYCCCTTYITRNGNAMHFCQRREGRIRSFLGYSFHAQLLSSVTRSDTDPFRSCMIRPEVMWHAVSFPPPASKFAAFYRDGGVYREEDGTPFPPPSSTHSDLLSWVASEMFFKLFCTTTHSLADWFSVCWVPSDAKRVPPLPSQPPVCSRPASYPVVVMYH